METHTYKSGTNRGNRRIWIEGARLLRAGINRGVKFSRTLDGDVMRLRFDGEGRHTVAGSDERPIVDLNGKYLNDFFGECAGFTATFFSAIENQPPRIDIVAV